MLTPQRTIKKPLPKIPIVPPLDTKINYIGIQIRNHCKNYRDQDAELFHTPAGPFKELPKTLAV